jgi:hypothetical protein
MVTDLIHLIAVLRYVVYVELQIMLRQVHHVMMLHQKLIGLQNVEMIIFDGMETCLHVLVFWLHLLFCIHLMDVTATEQAEKNTEWV